jgi:hypothetical protein
MGELSFIPESVADEFLPSRSHRRVFEAHRRGALQRLLKAGITLDVALAWIGAWDRMSRDLPDFRAKPDFWEVGYAYAIDEINRGFEPPVFDHDDDRNIRSRRPPDRAPVQP